MYIFESITDTTIDRAEYNNDGYEDMLKSLPEKFRHRFEYLLDKNYSIGVAHNILLYTQKMDDTEFNILVEQTLLSVMAM